MEDLVPTPSPNVTRGPFISMPLKYSDKADSRLHLSFFLAALQAEGGYLILSNTGALHNLPFLSLKLSTFARQLFSGEDPMLDSSNVQMPIAEWPDSHTFNLPPFMHLDNEIVLQYADAFASECSNLGEIANRR